MLERWLRAQRCSLLDAYELESLGGIAREANGRQIWPRIEGTLEPPPSATGHPIVARETTVPTTEALQPPSVCSSALPRAWAAALQPQTGSQTLIDPSPSLPPTASRLHATGCPRST